MNVPDTRTDDLRARLERALAGRYRLEHELGRGGMAIVWLARDLEHAQRPVALKVMRPEAAATLGAERFAREVHIAAMLSHPHIVPHFDSGLADGLPYLVMPVVEGESLRQRLGREPPLTLPEALHVAEGIASALVCAHAHGVVHRDIKPENVMLSGDQPMVTDFGIARARAAAGEPATGGATLVGTPGYMAPEQARGAPDLDERADVYALGCVLHEMLTGEVPRGWVDTDAAQRGRLPDTSTAARARLSALPPGIEAMLARALAAQPADRFPSAAAFADALRHGEPPLAPAPLPSVAVLPFECHIEGPEGAFLGDGLAEEITHALSRVRALRVAARSAAFAQRDHGGDLHAVGRTLGVRSVLEGSVRRAGDALRVTVQLSDAAQGWVMWSERYERPLRDVFALQDEIARAVTHALRGVLATESLARPRPLARVPTVDLAAYEFWLRGRRYFHERRRKSLEYARQMYERAIEREPSFALAHAGVADCSSLLHMYYPSSAPELERADRASLRALELAPDLPEAHAARGFALFQMRRREEAAAEFQTAIRLDPLQYDARYFMGRQCFQAGQAAEAARWFEDAARVEENVEARFFAAQAYEAAGRHDEAQAAYRCALEVAAHHLERQPDDPRAATMRAVALCRLGQPEPGLEWARRALEIDPEDAGVRYNVACLYALEGHRAEALACLAECVRLGFGNREWIERDPDLASLRDTPEYQRLVCGDDVTTTPPLPSA